MFVICFISQRFPAKENPNIEKALFDWPIVLQYDVKAKYRLISRKFSGMKFFHPSVRLTNQKPRAFVTFVSVCLLFLLCSRVSILRSYEIALSITWTVELNREEAEENFL